MIPDFLDLPDRAAHTDRVSLKWLGGVRATVAIFAATTFAAFALAGCSGSTTPDESDDPEPGTSGLPAGSEARVALEPMQCEHSGSGTAYDVGPDEAMQSIGDVPWEDLAAGDTVRIHWRDEPYREKFFLRGQGTKDQPIVVCGVAGPSGDLPIIDGEDAVARAGMRYPFSGGGEPRGLIHITLGDGDEWGYKPEYIVIQGLHIRNAFHEYSFTSSGGKSVKYADNASGLFIERGENITVRGVIIEGNGNGFFVASGDSEEVQSRDILLEHSQLYGNGTVSVANDRHHNIYTEAIGMVFQFNDIGPLREGSLGAALKDRSAGTVVRYNRIEGGSRTLDLVDAQDSSPIASKVPEYRTTLVYGNVLINGPVGPSNMIHYGGDSGLPEIYRKGTLYFYNNTVIVSADQEGENARWRTTLFDADTADETIDARNNVIVVRSATPGANATELAWMRHEGTLELGVNWASPAMFEWREDDKVPKDGGISGLDKIISNDDNNPGFANEAAGDFALVTSSGAAGKAEALHEVPVGMKATVDFEYVHPASGRERSSGAADMGAYSASGGEGSGGSTTSSSGTAVPGGSGGNPGGGGSTGSGNGTQGTKDSGSAKADGWSGPLQYLGKGPNGYDNGQRSACTGAKSGSPSVICVKAGGKSNGKGTASDPLGSINAALAAAAPGDVIQVAEGTYKENVAVGKFGDFVETHFSLLGGFSPDFSSRDASKFRSVIDGGGTLPGLQLHLQSGGKTVLDGFRITNGRGLGKTYEDGYGRGGGIFVELIGNGEVLISHNEVYGNDTNGAEDEQRGGGIFTEAMDWDGSKPVVRIEDNVVHSNQAGRGAGITVEGRYALILRNVVEANRAHSDHGGGIYLSTANADVTDNVVRGNEIGVTVKYGWGGGIIIAGVPAKLKGNIVAGNFAPTIGSGVFWDEGAKGTMEGDLLFDNGCSTDNRSGTALYVDGGAGPSIVTIERVTIARHDCPIQAPQGAAIAIEAGSKLTVLNSILWDNSGDFEAFDGGSFKIENSITTESGKGNRNEDPQFVDPANGDFHLKSGSPAKGAGAYAN